MPTGTPDPGEGQKERGRPWRAAVLSAIYGLLLSIVTFVAVGSYWVVNWTYGEETMIGVAANAMLIVPRLFLMAIASTVGTVGALRVTSVKRGDIAVASLVIGGVMCLAIVNWRRFLSVWYTDAFLGISLVEVAVALIVGVSAGAVGGVAANLNARRSRPTS
jgi:hypothetical protein